MSIPVLKYLILLTSVYTFSGTKSFETSGKGRNAAPYLYSFSNSYTFRDIISEIFYERSAPSARLSRKYRCLSIFQCIFIGLWDTICGTRHFEKLITPDLSQATFERTLNPDNYNPMLVAESVDFCKLAACKKSIVRKGTYFGPTAKKKFNHTVSFAKEDVEMFKELISEKYSISGYTMVHRIPNSKGQRSIIIAFHAARRDEHAEISLLLGMHRHGYELARSTGHIYLGWHAAMVEIIPQLKAFFEEILYRCNEEFCEDPVNYLQTISRVLFTGPCMGGVLTELSAFHVHHFIKEHIEKLNKSYENTLDTWDLFMSQELQRIQRCVHVYTFGSPRVGDQIFSNQYNSILGNQTFRLVNAGDNKPLFPYNKMGFRHIGQEVFFDYSHQGKGGEHFPKFEDGTKINEYGEDASLGAQGSPLKAVLPYLHYHTYYFGENIMQCFRK